MDERSIVSIERLGAQGDGVALSESAPLYIPNALPGERWRRAGPSDFERLTDSPQRVAPPCPHFGACGGCMAQHMADDLYNAWKHDCVVQAFAHRGIQVDVAPLRRVAPRSRRRAAFGVTRENSGITLGFREEGQHRLVDITECMVLDPRIVSALPNLRRLADIVLPASGPGARLLVTTLDQGLDVSIETSVPAPPALIQQAAALAQKAGVVRLTIGGEMVVSVPASLTIGPGAVVPPRGAFLQAVPEAERVMTDLVLAGLPKVKAIADLFCGVGTFTFALAKRAKVLAVEADRQAVGALVTAARGAKGIKPIETKVRDLFREPLSARELYGFDAVVFNPPRAGAQAQADRLSRSKVPVVVAVSCSPATLARDARILIDGGYNLISVTPVDQFIYTPHVEAVAVFRR